MNVLVIGSGGREHALVWKLRRSSSVTKLYCAPGNAGISELAELVPLKPTDLESLRSFALQEKIDLTVVGPEQPLMDGIVDSFTAEHLNIFGPSKPAAMLEGSKVFAKDFMKKNRIPTARYGRFGLSELHDAEKFIDGMQPPIVVKADGLAAGKGVIICAARQEALQALQSMMLDKVFGEAGERVVVEEFLKGEEASIFALTDGSSFSLISPAQDHKRIFDGDQGKNTGGMGAYAPAPIVTENLVAEIAWTIVEPTLEGMRKLGSPYRGCLYVGLMTTSDGPKVLEYNCRFGDPEAQVVLPLIEGDVGEILSDIARGQMNAKEVRLSDACAVCVVMASKGYPDTYETGKEVTGLDNAMSADDIMVFHAGTKKHADRVLTSGGRVLGVTAIDSTGDLEKAISNAYAAVDKISFDGAQFRRDIGQKALKKFKVLS